MDPFSVPAIRSAYEAVAEEYVVAFADDLQQLPLDVAVLDDLVESSPEGTILDLGCGPGQVAHWVAGRQRHVVGIDLAVRMLLLARSRYPGLSFVAGDMRALPIRSASCAGVVAYYSLQHLPRPALLPVLAEIRRVLSPNGLLAVTTHLGKGEIVLEEFLGRKVNPFGGTFYGAGEVRQALADNSFTVV